MNDDKKIILTEKTNLILEDSMGTRVSKFGESYAGQVRIVDVQSGEHIRFKAKSGEHYCIKKIYNSKEQVADEIIVRKVDENLIILYADGTEVIIDDYFIVFNNDFNNEDRVIILSANHDGGYDIFVDDELLKVDDTVSISCTDDSNDMFMNIADNTNDMTIILEPQSIEQADTLMNRMSVGVERPDDFQISVDEEYVVAFKGESGNAATGSSDTVAPSRTVTDIDISADSGTSDQDFITNTASQTITAKLDDVLSGDELLYGSVDGGNTWTDITNKVSGNDITWDGVTLHAGDSSIQFKVADTAGNDGAVSSQNYTLDTVAPLFNDGTSVSKHVDENTPADTVVHDANADNDNNITYSLGGIDQDDFNLDSSTGELKFNDSPDYENPVDSDTNNVYEISITATDTAGNTSAQDVTITVDDKGPGNTIDLGNDVNGSGINLHLIRPYTTNDNRTFYYLDRNKDGATSSSDKVDHNALDKLLNVGNDTTNDDNTRSYTGIDSISGEQVTIRLITSDELKAYDLTSNVNGWPHESYWSSTSRNTNYHNSVDQYNKAHPSGDTMPYYVTFEVV
jgi:hypothetical protein